MPIPADIAALGLSNYFTITPEGRVGISSAAPGTRLDVVGGIRASQTLDCGRLVVGGGAEASAIGGNLDISGGVSVASGFAAAAAGVPHRLGSIAITADGSIGLGITTPAAGLRVDVAGNARITGALTTTGVISATGFSGDGASLAGFAPSARIDTTNAANITTGRFPRDRLPESFGTLAIAGSLGIGTTASAPETGAGQALSAALDRASFAPTELPPGPMTASTTTFATASTLTPGLEGAYTLSASVEASPAWTAADASPSTQWLSPADYSPDYSPQSGALQTTLSTTGTAYYGHYLAFTAPRAIAVYGYKLVPAGSLAFAPGSWALFGATSPSPAAWTLLHSVSGFAWPNNDLSLPATFTVPGANPTTLATGIATPATIPTYRYFRFVITRTVSGSAGVYTPTAIINWRLLGTNGAFVSGAEMRLPLRVLANPAGDQIPNFMVSAEGRVGIGTHLPQTAFHVAAGGVRVSSLAAGGSGTQPLYLDAAGNLTLSVSDARLKENIVAMDAVDALARVQRLRPVRFDYARGAQLGERDIGLIAQELAEVFPEAVHRGHVPPGADAFLTVDYAKLVPALISAVQVLADRVRSLEERPIPPPPRQ